MIVNQLELERSLHRASRSDKPAIWLDCSLLEELSAETIEVLLAYAFVLRQMGRRMVLCHLLEPLQEELEQQDPTQEIAIVPTLLDVVVDEVRPRHLGGPGLS